jgi:hypothetical protein
VINPESAGFCSQRINADMSQWHVAPLMRKCVYGFVRGESHDRSIFFVVVIIMKIAVTLTLFLSFTASAEASHLPFLRHGGGEDAPVSESTCNAVRDKEFCLRTTDEASGDACMWCVAGAIPSECMSPDQAALLPAGVFDCAAPGFKAKTAAISSFAFESAVFGTTQTYSLVHPFMHASDDGPQQPYKSDLCDASSNSLAGYMDIQGSEYDASGENKHLFYWFFEKRGDDHTEKTPVRRQVF